MTLFRRLRRVIPVRRARPVRIVTDSTADLPSEIAAELEITVVPLQIIFGEFECIGYEAKLGGKRALENSRVVRIDTKLNAGFECLPDGKLFKSANHAKPKITRRTKFHVRSLPRQPIHKGGIFESSDPMS